jgi:hypothetical protein
MELGAIIEALYASEINCLAWFTVKLGDEMNGFVVENECRTASEADEFLGQATHEHFPDSEYALGKEERERRNDARKDRHRLN